MAGAGVQEIHCPLCSFAFLPLGEVCHTGCPMNGHCHMICCPNCGYQMVDADRSRLAGWLRKLWPGAAAKGPVQARPSMVLSEAPMRRDLRIESLDGLAPHMAARFSVLGLLPGATVQLLQRRPAPVVRVGETELAIGLELLEHVQVRAV